MAEVEALHAASEDWSDWYQLDDTALNGIYFSNVCNNGICKWRWDNHYDTSVKIRYRITCGSNKKEGEAILQNGKNYSQEYSMQAASLDGVSVAIIEPKYAGSRPDKLPPTSSAQVDLDNKKRDDEAYRRNLAILADQERQRVKEEQQRRNEIAEQQRRFEKAEDRRREEEQDERRQARRDADENRRQQAQDSQDFNNALAAGLQSMQNSINQGAQTYNNAVQANRDADDYLRRQKADREREAREQQRQRNEDAARQQRQTEENRRLQQQQQVALERSQREEQERQQRQRDEQQRVAQQEAEKQSQQQKKQLSCTNMTPSVSGTTKRLKGAGHCDGELAAYLTNNSGIKVMCEQKFEKNGVLPGSGSGAQVHIRPGETVGGESGGLWECGHADTDSYKYYCIPADEPYECMKKF